MVLLDNMGNNMRRRQGSSGMQQESVSELHSKDDTPGEEDTLGDGLVM